MIEYSLGKAIRGVAPDIGQRHNLIQPLISRLAANSKRLPGSRVLGAPFMTIRQAMGVAKGHDDSVTFLREFIEEAKASGLLRARWKIWFYRSIDRKGVIGFTHHRRQNPGYVAQAKRTLS